MYRISRLRFIFPIGLFICFFLDGSLSKLLGQLYFSYPYSMVSELALLWLVLAYFFEDDVQIPLTGFAILVGALADVYYSGIWGLFVFLYPLMVWLTRVLAKNFNPSFLTSILIFFIVLAVFELLNYWAYLMIGVVSVGFADFIVDVLAPTLALNLVYFVILYWPISRLYRKTLAKEQR